MLDAHPNSERRRKKQQQMMIMRNVLKIPSRAAGNETEKSRGGGELGGDGGNYQIPDEKLNRRRRPD